MQAMFVVLRKHNYKNWLKVDIDFDQYDIANDDYKSLWDTACCLYENHLMKSLIPFSLCFYSVILKMISLILAKSYPLWCWPKYNIAYVDWKGEDLKSCKD